MVTVPKQRLYLGIDGGGTKTEAVIAGGSGTILGRGTSAGANPHNVPLDIAYEHIKQAVGKAVSDAAAGGHVVGIHGFETVCLGLAGIDTRTEREKVADYFGHFPSGNRAFTGNRLLICQDGLIGLQSATDETTGVCLIASTGSNCYAVNEQGQASAGDWGYLLGDQGSGFAIGQKMLHRVIKESDGRCPPSRLTPAVLDMLGFKDPKELVPWAYGGHVPVKGIASLTRILNDPDFQNDPYLIAAMTDAADALIEAYRAVVTKLGMDNRAFPVVLVGGLFKVKPHLTDRVSEAIVRLTPGVRLLTTEKTPAEGATALASHEERWQAFHHDVITRIETH